MARGNLDLEIAVKAAVVNPGDTLILVTQARTAEQLDKVERSVAERLPGVRVACLGGIDQALVYKPDNEPSTRDTPDALLDETELVERSLELREIAATEAPTR